MQPSFTTCIYEDMQQAYAVILFEKTNGRDQ